jgi:predicted lipoprotein with Yx(FWY)xxD motif
MSARGRLTGTIVVGAALAVAGLGLAPAGASVSAVPRPAHGADTPAHLRITTHHSSLGRVVAAAHGRTVYLFGKDTPKHSACTKSCTDVWERVTSEHAATAGAHISAKHLRRIKHDQVTYYGHPLYYYVGDTKAGQTGGEDLLEFGAYWYVVTPKGNAG